MSCHDSFSLVVRGSKKLLKMFSKNLNLTVFAIVILVFLDFL